jgi:hypothetical protein
MAVSVIALLLSALTVQQLAFARETPDQHVQVDKSVAPVKSPCESGDTEERRDCYNQATGSFLQRHAEWVAGFNRHSRTDLA